MANFASVVRGAWARRDAGWWRQEFWWGGWVVIGRLASEEHREMFDASHDNEYRLLRSL